MAAACTQLREARPECPDPIPLLYLEMDGTGIPMLGAELADRPGQQADGSAKTREVKLGSVFTPTRFDAEGRPDRDYQSTTYVGSLEPAAEFGLRIRDEARRRGYGRAAQVVLLGDGAAWIWELARPLFPAAVQILDLFHALERLHALCDGLSGAGSTVAAVIAAARARQTELGSPPGDDLDKQIAFFDNQRHRMLYQTYRHRGFFCGAGVIEAGCKTVVGQRFKQSGMFWSEPGAQNLLDLRCLLRCHRWDPGWDYAHRSSPEWSERIAA